ncbi:indole-3-glycerol phosphate synthase TrpC [Paracoccus versutus]|uniref:indole-3-glycerol phosphate synthase TrpC n=1 Tax=Paracoccus versutus TaxID=34007 RepID=UPI001FB62C87|nr:indole-3-glycerol phosphate synthase TrpC [Paracoccus versutus]MCJ1901708.1 indole-3-glycerol phosphate synthase TrpC [Paracoccus versutus]
MSDTFLDRIKAYKLEEIRAKKRARSLIYVNADAKSAAPVRPFGTALRRASREGYGLIAEIKKASPSKGLIRSDFDPTSLAAAYAQGGATCLSVLTDTPSFMGKDEFLPQARSSCHLPVLRKEFMFDTYQVPEARALGADCILLIMAALDDGQAADLEAAASDWGMDVLIEVHDEAELDRATRLKSRLIGINNRDLKTFETDTEITRRLSKLAPEDCVLVSESGLSTPQQLADMARHGARCFLIGEALMKHNDVADGVRTMLSLAGTPPATEPTPDGPGFEMAYSPGASSPSP